MVAIPPGLATPDDVQTWIGRTLTAAERTLSGVLVDGVARKILARIPDLAQRLSAGTLDIDTVIMVQAQAVCRVLRNPDGYKTESTSGFAYEVDSRVAAGFLSILPEEWRDLGVATAASVAPATDAYARGRMAADPALWFQSGWPASDQLADTWGGSW